MYKKIISKYKMMPKEAKAAIWFLICSFLQKGISTLTTPIFTRLLSTSDYGQYNVFNSWLSIVQVLVSLNIYLGVYTQGLVKYENDRDVFSSSLQGLSLTLTFFWTVVYFAGSNFWNKIFDLTTVQMLCMLVMVWASSVFGYWAAEQRVTLKYKKLVAVTLIASVAKPVVGIIFVILAEDKVTARILGLALVEIICYTGLGVSQFRRGRVFFSKQYWKHAICFAVPLIPHYLSVTVLNSADRIMISNLVGSSAAGIYSLAYSISQIMTLVNSALINTLSPWLYKKIRGGQYDEITNISYIAILVVATSNVILIAFAPELVSIFAPSQYYDAIWIIPPVAIGVVFQFSYNLFASFEFYYEKKSFIATATTVAALLNIILNYIFIQLFGYYAAGYTTLICYMVYTLGHYFFMKKIVKKEIGEIKIYNSWILLGIYGLTLLCGTVMLFTYKHIAIRYCIIFILISVLIINRKKIFLIAKSVVNIRNDKT